MYTFAHAGSTPSTYIDTASFVLSWQHIVCVIKNKSFPKLAKSLQRILDGDDLKGMTHDFSNKAVRTVLQRLADKNNLSKEQLDYIEILIRNAQQFEKETNRVLRDLYNIYV